MRHSFFPAALVATWFIFGGGYNERYCAFADGGAGSYESCSFPTLEACRAYVHGVGGMCRINGRYVEEPPRRKPRKRYYN